MEERRVPRAEWPKDLAEHWNHIEEIEIGWWRQLKELTPSQMLVLAHAAVCRVRVFDSEVETLRAEIEQRDQISAKRGVAARVPAVVKFKASVKEEWKLARNPEKPRAIAGFASRMVAQKGAPITDPRTVLRWCRRWERELAAARVYRLASSNKLCIDVFDQVGLVREFICHDPDDPRYDPDC